jgi:hypothetical protein
VIEDRSAAAVGSERSILDYTPRRWAGQDCCGRSRIGLAPCR